MNSNMYLTENTDLRTIIYLVFRMKKLLIADIMFSTVDRLLTLSLTAPILNTFTISLYEFRKTTGLSSNPGRKDLNLLMEVTSRLSNVALKSDPLIGRLKSLSSPSFADIAAESSTRIFRQTVVFRCLFSSMRSEKQRKSSFR